MKRVVALVAVLFVAVTPVLAAITMPAGYYQGAIYFDNPAGITTTPSGDLYVLGRETGAVTVDGLYKPGPSRGPRLTAFDKPWGLLYHQGSLWVTEDYGGDLFKVNLDGTGKIKHVDQFVGCSGDDDPVGMTVAPAGFSGPNVNPGDLIVVDRGSTGNQVPWWAFTVDPSAPSPTTDKTLAGNSGSTYVAGEPYDPADAATGLDGSVYIVEHKRYTTAPAAAGLYKVDAAGNVSLFSTHAEMAYPNAVAVHPTTGKVYVGDECAGKVFEVDPTTGTAGVFISGLPSNSGNPSDGVAFAGLEWSPDGEALYVGSRRGDRVYTFTPDLEKLPADIVPELAIPTTVRAIPFSGPSGITFDANGNPLVCKRTASDGIYPVVDGVVQPRLISIADAADVLRAPNGDLFITQDYGGDFWRVPNGSTTPAKLVDDFLACPGDDDPTGIAIAPPGFDGPNVDPGDLIVVDVGSCSPSTAEFIYAVNPITGVVKNIRVDLGGTLPPTAMAWPNDIVATPDGRVFISDPSGNGHLWQLAPDGGLTELSLVDEFGAPVTLYDLGSVAVHPSSGMLYVGEYNRDQVFEIDPDTGVTRLFAGGFVNLTGASGGVGYSGIGWSPDGLRLYVADPGAGILYEFTIPEPTSLILLGGGLLALLRRRRRA